MSSFSRKLQRAAKKTTACSLAVLTAMAGVGAAAIPQIAAGTMQAQAAGILSNKNRGVIFADSRTDFRDESIYFLITTRFNDGDPSNNARTSGDEDAKNPADDPSWRGDFKGLIDKLDYIKALGFTAIWITPVVTNHSGYDYHGYHAYDFSAVDTRYESNGVTYQTLIDAVHAKGMKIIQDVVVNHTCNFGEKNLLQIGPADDYPARTKVVMNGTGDPENIYHHNAFCGGGDWDNYEAQDRSIHGDCFDLETENPKVINYLNDCYTNYINMGVDAFRVDTVKHVSRLTFNAAFVPTWKAAGGDKFYMFGEVCTKGHDVWYREHPPISTCFYTWAEDGNWLSQWSKSDLATNESLVQQHYTSHNDTNNQPTSTNAFLNGNNYHTPDYSMRSGMDVIDFQMHWSFNDAGSAYRTALGEDRYFNDSTWNVVYVDSHDYAPDQNQDNRYTGGTDKWAENLSLMFTFRGIPCVYYGSEIEFQAGMPIDKGSSAAIGTTGRAYYGDKIAGTVKSGTFGQFNNTSGEVASTLRSTLSQHIIRLNRIRQSVPALRKGQYSTEGCSGSMSFKRRYTDATTDSFALVTISGSSTFTGIPNGTYVDAVTGDTQTVTGGTLTANCSGQGNLRVYVLNTDKTPAPGRVIPNGAYLTDGGSATLIEDEPFDEIAPTSLTLNKTTTSVMQGKNDTLTATVLPDNASDKTVSWFTSNASVATVSGGVITGVGVGTATITATANGNSNLKATCTVTVIKNPDLIDPTGITLDKTTMTITAGDSATLTATVAPANATNKTVTWTSSNASVATVTNGTVKGVAAGTAVITAETVNGFKATCTVTVEGPAFEYVDHGFYFEKPSGWGSNINVYIYDVAAAAPIGDSWPGRAMKDIGNNMYSYEYSTTDSNVRLIFNDGSNQTPGQDMEGYKYVDQGLYNSSGFVKIIEKEEKIEVTSVTISNASPVSVAKGSTVTLSATVAPSNATNKTLTWTSSDASVATVSASGVVTGVAKGSATITATSNNGKSASVTVNVTGDDPTPVSASVTLSATSVKVNNPVTITASASGGTAPYQYAYYYKLSSASSYTTLANFSTATSKTFTPDTAGTYTIKVTVKDSAGAAKDVTKTLTVTPDSTLVNNSKVSSTSISLGETVTITGAASGGTPSYKYAYYYKTPSDSDWKTLAIYSTATSKTYTPSVTGTHKILVTVKDSTGETKDATFTVTVDDSDPLTNKSSLSKTSVEKGTAITIKGAASGGSTPYKYAYYYKFSTKTEWTTIASYSTATSKSFTPEYTGTYNIKVVVKDNNGKTAAKTINLTVTKPTDPLVNNSSLSKTTITKGASVTIKAAATGGTTPYKYAYYYKLSTKSDWTTIADYSTATSKTWTPSYTGTYNVKVVVKDNASKTAAKTINLTVEKPTDPLANNSSISKTSIEKGASVTLKGAATGGTTPYKYAYYYKLTTKTEWTKIADFSTTASKTWKPAYSGTYDVKITVKDAASKTADKTFILKVVVPETLKNTSTVSATKVPVGTAVTLKGSATGGSTPYKFAYYYKKSTTSSWTTLKDFSTSTYAKFTPGAVATYEGKVIVKDNSGKTAVLTFTVTAYKESTLANTSTVKNNVTSVTAGTEVTLLGSATGGSTPYQFAYYYKKSTSSNWTTLKEYSASTYAKFTPAAVATYEGKVVVKDSTGKTVEKTFTVKSTAASSATTALTNKSTISKSSVTKGTQITITGAASGGTSPYKYAFYIRKESSSNWSAIGTEFGTATKATYKPAAVAKYIVRVDVMDSTGKKVSKEMTLNSVA